MVLSAFEKYVVINYSDINYFVNILYCRVGSSRECSSRLPTRISCCRLPQKRFVSICFLIIFKQRCWFWAALFRRVLKGGFGAILRKYQGKILKNKSIKKNDFELVCKAVLRYSKQLENNTFFSLQNPIKGYVGYEK